MFAKVAAGIVAHPWRVLIGWVVVAIAIIGFSPSLDDYVDGNQQNFLPSTFESVAAQGVGDAQFPQTAGAGGTIVVARPDGDSLSPADQQLALGIAPTLQDAAIPGVVTVSPGPQPASADGKVVALQVVFDGQPGDEAVNAAVTELRSATATAVAGTDLSADLTGNAAILVDTNDAYAGAETIISIATVLIILILLGLVFRSPLIAVLPIVVIGVVYAAVQGLTAWAADLLDYQVSTSLSAIMIVVLFGVGADYIVFLLFRYRERLRRGDSPDAALTLTTAVVGRVVASSAITVIGAFAALFLAKLGSLTSLALGLILAVAGMLVTALTLIPALFALIGKHLFWPLGPGQHRDSSRFGAVGAFVSARPSVVTAAILVLLVALGSFAFGYRATYNTLEELPADTVSQQAFDTLAASFPPGVLSPTQVYVTSDTPLTAERLAPLTERISQVTGVAAVAPPRVSAGGTAAQVNVIFAMDPYSAEALDLVDGPVRDAAHDAVPGATTLVGGQSAVLADVRTQLDADTRLVFPIAALLVVLILAMLLRSVLAPVNLIVAVALTFAATLGVLTLVFVNGAGFSGIDFTTPIVLYLFVVAIGTDYNILMAERIREEFVSGHSPREATRIAIAMDAPTVFVAGAILALTFAALVLSGLANLMELGVGVATGVVLASMAMAPLLVPALAALQGKPFWWPTRSHAAPVAPSEPELDQTSTAVGTAQ